MTLFGLVSGWRLWLGLLRRGSAAMRAVWRGWWIASIGMAAASTVTFMTSLLLRDAFDSQVLQPLQFLVMGVMFVPSFAHLSAEVWLRNRPDAAGSSALQDEEPPVTDSTRSES